MTVSLSCFFAGKTESTASAHLHTLTRFTTKLSFNSEDFKRAQLFAFENINISTNTAQTSANTISRPLPEAWNWQTEWKTTVDNTWVRCRIEMNQSKKTKIKTRLKFRIEMNQSNTCCVSWEVLLVSWKTNGGLKIHKMAGPLTIKDRVSSVNSWIFSYP